MSALPRPALYLALLLGLPMAALQPPGPIQLPAQAVLESRFLVATCAMNPDATLNVVIDRLLGGGGEPARQNTMGTSSVARHIASKQHNREHPDDVEAMPESAPCLALGRIPRSILATGEPVTALVVGTSRPGATVRGRALGLLTRIQDGRTEYRVVVVPPDGPCGRCTTLDQLEAAIPELRAGFRLAFGPAAGTARQGRKEAVHFVGDAVSAFEGALVQESDKRQLGKDGNPVLYRWPGARNAAD